MMFEILCQFIENECSPGRVEWYGEYSHMVEVELPGGKKVMRNVRDEMQDLHDWWINDYHGRYKKLEARIQATLAVHDAAYCISDFTEDDDNPEYTLWDPQYDTPENKQRGRDLLMDLNRHERFAAAALDRRMHRLVNITQWMWT
jgi:hypothetical protein